MNRFLCLFCSQQQPCSVVFSVGKLICNCNNLKSVSKLCKSLLLSKAHLLVKTSDLDVVHKTTAQTRYWIRNIMSQQKNKTIPLNQEAITQYQFKITKDMLKFSFICSSLTDLCINLDCIQL